MIHNRLNAFCIETKEISFCLKGWQLIKQIFAEYGSWAFIKQFFLLICWPYSPGLFSVDVDAALDKNLDDMASGLARLKGRAYVAPLVIHFYLKI